MSASQRKFSRLIYYSKLSLLLSLFLILATCQSNSSQQNFQRDNTPWVVRSVLDQKPRMISLALNSNLWAAYSTQFGSLYKVWKGGIDFDGAVYTTRHGPQPATQGGDYFANEHEKPWVLIENGKETEAKFRYHGHAFEKGQVKLMYVLETSEGEKVMVEEKPEYVEGEDGKPGFERVFSTKNVPNGTQVALRTNVGGILTKKSLETNGDFQIEKEDSESLGAGKATRKLDGLLILKSNATTFIKTYFYPDGIKEIERDDSDELSPEQLIAMSDCHSCHNEQKKTVGPAYVTVAKKYNNTLKSVDYLAKKIINGGKGVWGEVLMTAHPDVTYDQAQSMARYILALDTEEKTSEMEAGVNQGVAINVYQFNDPIDKLPEIKPEHKPVISTTKSRVVFNTSLLKPLKQQFLAVAKGKIKIERPGSYVFRSRNNNGGSRFTLDGRKLIDFDGVHDGGWEPSEDAEVQLEPGVYSFTFEYFRAYAKPGEQGDHWWGVMKWKPAGADKFDNISEASLIYDANDLTDDTEEMFPVYEGPKVPGDKMPLAQVHPSFDLSQARPDDFQPRVAGMDFLSDGRMVISTWDSLGAVYILSNLDQPDHNKIEVKRIAQGFAEPLGLKVVEDTIYVLQKQELTKLVDKNGDDVIDEYLNVCNGWKVSANFHEFAFGLVYKEGFFYAALATAINPGGASTQPQIPDRGKVVKIDPKTGSHEFIATGLRTPNGMGIGVDGEIFNCDNQGDWLPSSKVVHVRKGAYFGSRSVDFEGTADLEEAAPVVWMPQDEIGNSPAQIGLLNIGPYKNNLIVGEVTHGGVKRVHVEKIDGQYQGALFRFTQGIEAGVNRLVWGPDGALYVGGIGVNGNWGHYVDGKMGEFALQKLSYNKNATFEMLAVRAHSDGVELEFTEPIEEGAGVTADSYEIKQWWYKPTENYGGPKMDEEALNILSVNMSKDRKKVFLELEGMKAGHVVYVRIKDHFLSTNQNELWQGECWYTMNRIPKNKPGFRSESQEALADNTLSNAEEKAGWKLLFDGETTEGWHIFNQEGMNNSWQVNDGVLSFAKGRDTEGGDITTDKEYQNFELKLDWKVSKGGNSGVFFNVVEGKDYGAAWQTGVEVQVLDNAEHPDARIHKHRAGDLYDMIACKFEAVRPAEEWNRVRIIVNNGKVEQWMNGHKLVEYEMWTDKWNEMVANSKFKDFPAFGKAKKGNIALQDHGDKVYFKNIKIKEL